MKKYLVLALFAVLGTALATPSLSLNYEVSPASLNPGGSGQIILSVANAGISDADNVKVTLTSRSYGIAVVSGRADLETVSALSASSGAFAIRALDSTKPGTYILDAKGTYKYGTETGSFTVSIPVVDGYRSGLVIFAADTQITPGATENILINIQNMGKGEIKDLIVTLSNTNTLVYTIGDVRRSISSIGTGDIEEANFRIRASDSVTPGIESLLLSVTYTDAAGSTQTDTQPIAVTVVDAGTELVIDSIESNLEPGKTGSVRIGVRNVGSSNLENLYFSLSPHINFVPNQNAAMGSEYFSVSAGDSIRIRGSNEKLLDRLNSGEIGHIEFEFYVLQDAEAVPVSSVLSITYQHEGGKKQFSDSKPLGIPVDGSVDLRIIDKSIDRRSGEIEIDIANYGNKDADAVRVEAWSGGKLFGTGYTDKIRPNRHKVFRFGLPDSTDVIIRISHKDYSSESDEIVNEERIAFESSEIAQEEGDGTWALLVLFAIGVIVLVLWRRRSQNKVKIDVSKYK